MHSKLTPNNPSKGSKPEAFDTASKLISEIPANLYSEEDLETMRLKADQYDALFASATREELISIIAEMRARQEVAEQHLNTALQTNAQLMVWHIQTVNELNNVICGRTAQAIEMPFMNEVILEMKDVTNR